MKLITILGATASGKTSIAVRLAAEIGGEVISGDSRQVYRGMDIGTGKDLNEYMVDGFAVPYHLIDIADAGSKYNLYEYCSDFRKAYADICQRGRQPILCGGSGLYIEAAAGGYALPQTPDNPALRASLEKLSAQELVQKLSALQRLNTIADPHNRRRLIRAIEIAIAMQQGKSTDLLPEPLPSVYFCIVFDRQARRRRISERLMHRLRNGMVEEVEGLMKRGVSAEMLYWYGLEYRYVAEYLTRKLTYDEMRERLEIAIHQFAKRQMTWFRGMERRGAVIHKIDGSLPLETKVEMIKNLFSQGIV